VWFFFHAVLDWGGGGVPIIFYLTDLNIFPVLPADSSSPDVGTRPVGVTNSYRYLTGHLTTFWPSNLARCGVKTHSFSCLNPPWPSHDLTAETDVLSKTSVVHSKYKYRTLLGVSSRVETVTDVSYNCRLCDQGQWILSVQRASQPTSEGVHSGSTLQNYKSYCCQWQSLVAASGCAEHLARRHAPHRHRAAGAQL